MKRKRFTVEQIMRMLREAEVHLSQGKSVKLVSRELGITGLPPNYVPHDSGADHGHIG